MTRKVALYTSVFVAASLALVGCSSANDPDANGGVEKTLDVQSAADFTKTYYVDLIKNKSNESLEASRNLSETVNTAIGEESGSKLVEDPSPSTALQSLTDEENEKLAEAMINATPVSSYIDYDGLENWEKSYLNLVVLGISAMGTYSSAETAPKDIGLEVEAISSDGKAATVDNDKLSIITENGGEVYVGDALGTNETFLKNVNGEWKIDGDRTLESLQELESKGEVSEGSATEEDAPLDGE